ncbi:response regulator [Clostridiales bacterium]|nr:response regulator [Clostridiales bacterium]
MKNQPGDRKIFNIFRLCFLMLLAVSAIGAAVYTVTNPQIETWGSDVIYLDGLQARDKDGNPIEITANQRYEYDENNILEVNGTLPDRVRDGDYICFLTWYDTEILVNGEEINRFSASAVTLPGGLLKSVYFFTPLQAEYAGQPVTIRYHRGEDSDTCRVFEMTVGTRADLYRMIVEKYGTTFSLGLIILAIAGLVLLIGLFLQIGRKNVLSIIDISLGVGVTAAWILLDSYFYPFVFGSNHIDGIASYLVCLLLPFPYIAYMSSLQKGRHRRTYMVMNIITLAMFILCTLLHFTGLVKFYDTLPFIDFMLAAFMLAELWILVGEYRQGYLKTYRYTAIGFIGMMLFGMGEIVMILRPTASNDGSLILVGLLFLLIFAITQQLRDMRNTELEKQRAMELSRTKTDFLASMSHEIRTPINSILGMNEMILRENKDPEIENYANTIQRSGRMLLGLVNDVLDFSRIEAGVLEITPADYRLTELLTDIAFITREQTDQKGLAFEISVAPGVPDGMYSDEFRIKQILLNLISNAVKYTDKGKVTILVGGEYETPITEKENEIYRLKLTVQDTGRGIREEDRDHLFEAFRRSDLKVNRSIEGTGLGLAIVKNIVDSMHGTVSVESEYNEGSSFTVELPQEVTDKTPVPANPEAVRQPVQPDAVRRTGTFTAPEARILAVDDNRPNLSIVSALLKETEIKIDLCSDGRQALIQCRRNQYDLILLDHMMPEPDGIQTLEMIRKDPHSKNRSTPAVVLTANAVAGSREMYMKAGFADYLTKPLDSALLEKTVRNYIPTNKIHEIPKETKQDPGEENEIFEFEPEGEPEPEEEKIQNTVNPISTIEGIDYQSALANTGGSEEFLRQIMLDIASEAPDKVGALRRSAREGDLKAYRIAAHSIKGLMATIGASQLSDKAKMHEYAATEGRKDYITAHVEELIQEYEQMTSCIIDALK